MGPLCQERRWKGSIFFKEEQSFGVKSRLKSRRTKECTDINIDVFRKNMLVECDVIGAISGIKGVLLGSDT